MKKYLILLPVLVALCIASCSPQRLTYLEGIGYPPDTTYQKVKSTYRLQPNDILYIRIITQDEKVNEMFNPILGEGGTSNIMQGAGLYLMGFNISDSGYIDLPILREIPVAGLTIEEAKEKITRVADQQLIDPMIIVRLSTFEITVLGEVGVPGLITYATHEMNLLEALALAGDITYNGNRENILIMRPVNDKYELKRLDLTNKDLVGSQDFFVQPNDIIYVEPLRRTLFRETTSDYMFFISALTGFLSLLVLIVNFGR